MAIPKHLVATGRLSTYRPQQQHAGMFLAGFDWRLYCTGTFRRMPQDDDEAVIYLDRFVRQLGSAMRFPRMKMAYYAALEDQTPGLGGRPVRKHWHWLMACPDHPLLQTVAQQLWEASNGWSKITSYDPNHAVGYYLSKLLAQGALPYEHNLDKLPYSGPADLIQAGRDMAYVPGRLQDKVSGEFLVVRR
jgi:hypothetical protein